MAFRSDEAAATGYERTKAYLIPLRFSQTEREQSEEILKKIVRQYGPVVDRYPIWHPLVRNHDERDPGAVPSERCLYHGLDHTIYLAHGFITCPYDDGSVVIDSVENLPQSSEASISAELLDAKFCRVGTTAVFVRCDWREPLEAGNLIPKKLAIPLMLERELPYWRQAQRGETWESMRPYLLGTPHGNRSSLFVSQDTALAMKKMHLALLESGMFGPIP